MSALATVKDIIRWIDEDSRLWILWLSVTNLIIAIFALGYPSFLGNPAYGWATAIIPIEAWGILMIVVSALAFAALVTDDHVVRILALSLSSWVQFMFGLSVFALTLSGATSAISGSIQWWAGAAVSMNLLRRGGR